MMNTYGILILGVITLSLFTSVAYAQFTIGGLPVPIDQSSIFMSLLVTNLLWIIPAVTAGVVI